MSTTSPIVQVSVDPRIELMSVIQLLTEYWHVSRYETAYRRLVQTTFAHMLQHPAVQYYAQMWPISFNFDSVPNVFLCLTDPPALLQRGPFPDDSCERGGGPEALEQWLEDVRDFASQSHFMEFFSSQKPLYDTVIVQAQSAADAAIGPLRQYLGTPLENCRLVLGLLLHHGGFGPTISPTPGPEEYYALIGPLGSERDQPIFGSASDIAEITWHEWSHTVINPIADAHADVISRSEQLHGPIRDIMYAQGYDSWHITVIEHVIHAITTRLTTLVFGASAGAAALEHVLDDDYRYVPVLLERLKTYEAQRDHYPTIASFFPELVRALGE